MKNRTKRYLVILAMVMVAGCATNSGYQTESSVEQKILTMTKAQILLDLGPPTKKTVLKDGVESYRYDSEVGGLTGGVCTLTILFEANKPTDAKLVSADLPVVSLLAVLVQKLSNHLENLFKY